MVLGQIFGAIVRLDDFSDVPDSFDLSTPDVLGVSLLTPPGCSNEVSAPLSLELEPGTYALVFGSGLFGATGAAFAPTGSDSDIGTPYIAQCRAPDIEGAAK